MRKRIGAVRGLRFSVHLESESAAV
jgi:hypothetical protein